MNSTAQDLLPANPPSDTWLCQSENLNVYYARVKPTCWPVQQHRQAKFLLTFDDACAEVIWQNNAGYAGNHFLNANQFCVIPASCRHALDWKSEADLVVVLIDESMVWEHVNGSLRTVVVGDFQALARQNTCLWSIGRILRDLCRTPVAPPFAFIEGIGTALVARTLERHFQQAYQASDSRPKLTDEALHRMTRYIHAHMHEPIAVVDLARDAALSVDYFSKLVKNKTGLSPLRFLQKCRVEKALELLRTGEFRVAEAALEVGFYDQSHLDRQCRKFFGFSAKTACRRCPARFCP